MSFKLGQLVEARTTGGWADGKVVKENPDGTYDVLFLASNRTGKKWRGKNIREPAVAGIQGSGDYHQDNKLLDSLNNIQAQLDAKSQTLRDLRKEILDDSVWGGIEVHDKRIPEGLVALTSGQGDDGIGAVVEAVSTTIELVAGEMDHPMENMLYDKGGTTWCSNEFTDLKNPKQWIVIDLKDDFKLACVRYTTGGCHPAALKISNAETGETLHIANDLPKKSKSGDQTIIIPAGERKYVNKVRLDMLKAHENFWAIHLLELFGEDPTPILLAKEDALEADIAKLEDKRRNLALEQDAVAEYQHEIDDKMKELQKVLKDLADDEQWGGIEVDDEDIPPGCVALTSGKGDDGLGAVVENVSSTIELVAGDCDHPPEHMLNDAGGTTWCSDEFEDKDKPAQWIIIDLKGDFKVAAIRYTCGGCHPAALRVSDADTNETLMLEMDLPRETDGRQVIRISEADRKEDHPITRVRLDMLRAHEHFWAIHLLEFFGEDPTPKLLVDKQRLTAEIADLTKKLNEAAAKTKDRRVSRRKTPKAAAAAATAKSTKPAKKAAAVTAPVTAPPSKPEVSKPSSSKPSGTGVDPARQAALAEKQKAETARQAALAEKQKAEAEAARQEARRLDAEARQAEEVLKAAQDIAGTLEKQKADYRHEIAKLEQSIKGKQPKYKSTNSRITEMKKKIAQLKKELAAAQVKLAELIAQEASMNEEMDAHRASRDQLGEKLRETEARIPAASERLTADQAAADKASKKKKEWEQKTRKVEKAFNDAEAQLKSIRKR